MSLIGLVVLLQLDRTAQIVALASLALGRRLPVHEADHLVAAGLARPGLLLGRAGRLAGGRRAISSAPAWLLWARRRSSG